MNNKQYLLVSATITLFLVRLWKTIMVIFFEKSFLWQSIKNDNFDHYQLGFLLLFICGLFWKKLSGKLKMIICGVGLGLIIDDAYQILSILFGFPYTFNGFLELTSLLIFYLAFLSYPTIKRKIVRYTLGIVGITVSVTELIITAAHYFIGKTHLWNSIENDNWHHYQLGLVLVFISLFLRQKLGKYFIPAVAISIGLIINGIEDVLRVFGFNFPLTFGDTPFDFLLILLSFLLFVCVVKLAEVVFDQLTRNKDKSHIKKNNRNRLR